MSSLRDDVNSRAYASVDRYWRNRDLDAGLIDRDLACVECLEDGVEIDSNGRCAECRPTDTETEAEWAARIAVRRAAQ